MNSQDIKVRRALWDAADRIVASWKPCFNCSSDKDLRPGGLIITWGTIRICKTSHNPDGTCCHCGHITSPEEYAALTAQEESINEEVKRKLGKT